MDELTDIRSVRPEWTRVMERMILVNLTVARWRGRKKIQWNEIGLPQDAFDPAYTPGVKRLLPRDVDQELDQLEQLARDLLQRLSYRTLFGFMLPKEKYFEFKAWLTERPLADLRQYLYHKSVPEYADETIWKNTTLEARWWQVRDALVEKREELDSIVTGLYDRALENIWRRLESIPAGELTGAQQIALLEWMDGMKHQIADSIPPAAQLRDSFTLTWELAEVEAPPEAVKGVKLEELERKQSELERSLAAAATEEERLRLLRQREQLVMDRRIAAEIARMKEGAQEQFNEVIDGIIREVQGSIYDMVLKQLEYMNEDGGLRPLHTRNIGSIKNLVELVRDRLAGLTNDEELRRVCGELETLTNSGVMTREEAAPQVRAALTKIGISMKADLVLAGVPSRSGREMGIPDAPSESMVRSARRMDEGRLLDVLADGESVTLSREARVLETERV